MLLYNTNSECVAPLQRTSCTGVILMNGKKLSSIPQLNTLQLLGGKQRTATFSTSQYFLHMCWETTNHTLYQIFVRVNTMEWKTWNVYKVLFASRYWKRSSVRPSHVWKNIITHTSQKLDNKIWTELNKFRIWTTHELLWTYWWILGFH
jgi:hypothetical protein